MIYSARKWAGTASAIALMCEVSHAALTIEKVIPFATDQEVRVQVTVKGEAAAPVQLEGKIVPIVEGAGPLWQGALATATPGAGGIALAEQTVKNLKPKLWTPATPNLYNLTITAKQGSETATTQPVRIGFRSVSTKNGQILLNGKPIFLCGIAINPPGRDIPDDVGYSKEFATAYVKYLRSQHVNLIRMTFDFQPEPRQQAWFDACDELGMMVDQGCYGGPPGQGKKGPSVDPEEQPDAFAGKDPNAPRSSKSAPPDQFEASVKSYIDVFETYARHPSIIIYILSNELPGPVGSKPEWHDFLTKVDARINQWDPTRLVIGNAGYGLGREGDINDVHRYWGWYYNSFLTYYNLRDSVSLFGASTDKQPFTFSECVGSFTSPLGGFNAIFRKQLAPQLGWTGHSGEQPKDALAHQAFMIKHALESFRTMREQNHRIAGLMPFTILFFNWEGIRSFDEMKSKPAMEQMGISYSPVLTSIELWTSQVYAGTKIRPIVHVVNDAEDFSDLTGAKLKVQILSGASAQLDRRINMGSRQEYWHQDYEVPTLKYFEARAFTTNIEIPQVPTGEYTLRATLERNGQTVSSNEENLYIAALAGPMGKGKVMVYDPSGQTQRALQNLSFATQPLRSLAELPAATIEPLIIGEGALTSAPPLALKQFITNGGRVLCLAQNETCDTSWMPARIEMLKGTATDPTYTPKIRPTADQQNVNPERPWHPILKGIGRERLRLWSDYTGWDQSKQGFPKVYPVTHGFKLTDANDLSNTAIIADYDRGLEGIAIAEMFDGKGSVVFTGLDLVNRCGYTGKDLMNRIGVDPIADQMLINLVSYLSAPDHEIQPLVDKPIVWGDYPTERGVLTGPIHGLVYNCRWVPPPTAPNAKPMPDNTGAWNTNPGNPFVPKGIRPFGPFTWSTGASPREESKEPVGSGMFHCRVPAGRSVVLTKVENTAKDAQSLTVAVNGQAAPSTPISPGQTITVKTPIAAGATNLSVQYTGNKQLVIMETAFE